MSFFEEERATSGEIASGPPSTLAEIADAAVKSAWYADNWGAKNVAREEAYDRRIDDIFAATGVRLENPLRERVARSDLLADRPVRFGRRDVWDAAAGVDDFQARDRRFLAELDRLAAQFPEAMHLIKPGRSPDADAEEKAAEAKRASQGLLARYRGLPGTGTLAEFAGGFAGSLRDPLNVATMALGPTGRAGAGLRGLAWMGLKQGAANAAVEAAQQPWVAAWNREIGVGYDAGAFFGNVGGAFTFGFAADALVRGGIRGVQGRLRGREAILDPDGGIVGWRKPGEPDDAGRFGLEIARETGDDTQHDIVYRVLRDDKPTGKEIRGRLEAGTMHLDFLGGAGEEMRPEVVMRLARLVADRFPQAERFTGTVGGNLETGRLIARAIQDDAAAIRELARRSGADQDPRTKTLMDMLDDVEATSTRAPGLDPDASDWADLQAGRHLADPNEPPPAAVPRRPLVLYRGEGPADPLRRQNRRGEWYTTDLERALGYAGDHPDRRGVFRIEVPPERVKDLQRGIDGSEYMVPRDLDAGRAAVEPETVAVRHELAGGGLDVLEMAALMRERPEAVDASVPLSTETARQADAISRLSEAAFDMVMRGEASPENAALVGRLVEDGARQAGILAELSRLEPSSPREARTSLGVLLQEADPVERAFDGIDDVYGPEGQRQIDELERMLGVAPEPEPELEPVRSFANLQRGDSVGLGRENATVEVRYGNARATVRLEGRTAVIETLEAKPQEVTYGDVVVGFGGADAPRLPLANMRKFKPAELGDAPGAPRVRWKGIAREQLFGAGAGDVARMAPRERAPDLSGITRTAIGDSSSERVARVIAGHYDVGAGQGEATLLVRALSSEADQGNVVLRAMLTDVGEGVEAKPPFLNPTMQRGILRLYGFRGDGAMLERRPVGKRGPAGWSNAPPAKIAHPAYGQIQFTPDADGNVRFYRGEKPGQTMKGNTHRMFTTDLDRARQFAGPEGIVHEVALPPGRLGEAVPRGATRGDASTAKAGETVFVLDEKAAGQVIEARGRQSETSRLVVRDEPDADGPVVALEREALDEAPDADLRRGLDDADGLQRLAEVIGECKI